MEDANVRGETKRRIEKLEAEVSIIRSMCEMAVRRISGHTAGGDHDVGPKNKQLLLLLLDHLGLEVRRVEAEWELVSKEGQ